VEQVSLDISRRCQGSHFGGQGLQSARQHHFIAKSLGTILARVNVRQRFTA
jgi:hypothetical protein